MPFRVKDGTGIGKLITPGKEFHLNVAGKDIAVLAVEKDKPKHLHVTNLVGADVLLMSGPGFRTYSNKELSVACADISIKYLLASALIFVVYEP
ncbi:MAG: hypothetical protein WCK10_03715 [Candidatus Staskawiczbacteria bacterium]